MSHFKAKIHQIRFLVSVHLSLCSIVRGQKGKRTSACPFVRSDGVWHLGRPTDDALYKSTHWVTLTLSFRHPWSTASGPQPDTSWSCTGPVRRTVCLFTPPPPAGSLCRYQIILLGNRGKCVWATCSRSHLTAQQLGLTPQCPIACSTPQPLQPLVTIHAYELPCNELYCEIFFFVFYICRLMGHWAKLMWPSVFCWQWFCCWRRYIQLLGVVPTDAVIEKRLGEMFDAEGDKNEAFTYFFNVHNFTSLLNCSEVCGGAQK